MRESGPASAEPEFIVGAKRDGVNRRVPWRLRLCSPLIRHPPARGALECLAAGGTMKFRSCRPCRRPTGNWKLETENWKLRTEVLWRPA